MSNAQVIIFSHVWPEPKSSAAGVRQMHWIHLFRGMGYFVTLVSPSKVKQEQDWGALDLPEGVSILPLPLNQESVKEDLRKLNPAIIMFDRFLLEEQFGPHVYEACPDALILMETQDLNFVRRAREELKEGFLSLENISPQFYQTETALRETSALMRVDYSFVVSSFEEKLLRDEFKIGDEKVKWVPFFYEKPIAIREQRTPFQDRAHFCWIGNFLHEPNLDGLRWFRNEIWPLIREQLPQAQIKVYGAYPPKEAMEWNGGNAHQGKNGFTVMGHAETLEEVFSHARVNVAPLRFGAGVKGKIIEGFRFGLPCVSTKIGSEGLFGQFPGLEANTAQDFANACVKLHEDETQWKKYSLMALEKMMEVCAASARVPELQSLITELLAKKSSRQLPDWLSRVLRFEGNQSRYYFTRWIEAKNK